MNSTLSLGIAQPVSVLGDLAANVLEHSRAVLDLEARLVVFPELSLTGYAMNLMPVDPEDHALEPLVEACAMRNSIALVGAPTRPTGGARRRISILRVDRDGAEVVYDKMHLGGEEPHHYGPGDTPAVLEVEGWRLGLAICRDTGQPEQAAATTELGIDAYIAGVCESEEDREVQPRRSHRIINDHSVWVAYASFAGPTGGGFADTAGRSAVRDPEGNVRLQLGKAAGQRSLTILSR